MASAGVAGAQSRPVAAYKLGPLGIHSNPACIDTISASRLSLRLVFQQADFAATDSALVPQIAWIAEALGNRVRAAFGDSDSVARVDTLADWRHLQGTVPISIVLYRDRPTVWRVDSAAKPYKSRITALYARALRELNPSALTVIWPRDLSNDSSVLHFTLDALDNDDSTHLALRKVPVFSTLSMAKTGVVTKRGWPARYPEQQAVDRYAALVILDAVIDTTGRVDRATLHDIESAKPAAKDRYNWRYRQFEEAAKSAMASFTFTPAHIGGCAIRQEVMMPFNFETRASR